MISTTFDCASINCTENCSEIRYTHVGKSTVNARARPCTTTGGRGLLLIIPADTHLLSTRWQNVGQPRCTLRSNEINAKKFQRIY